MKKQVLIAVMTSMLLLSACSDSRDYDYGYEDGYENGYEDGYGAMLEDHALEYVQENYSIGEVFSDEIVDYVRDNYSIEEIYDIDTMAEYLIEQGYAVLD